MPAPTTQSAINVIFRFPNSIVHILDIGLPPTCRRSFISLMPSLYLMYRPQQTADNDIQGHCSQAISAISAAAIQVTICAWQCRGSSVDTRPLSICIRPAPCCFFLTRMPTHVTRLRLPMLVASCVRRQCSRRRLIYERLCCLCPVTLYCLRVFSSRVYLIKLIFATTTKLPKPPVCFSACLVSACLYHVIPTPFYQLAARFMFL